MKLLVAPHPDLLIHVSSGALKGCLEIPLRYGRISLEMEKSNFLSVLREIDIQVAQPVLEN